MVIDGQEPLYRGRGSYLTLWLFGFPLEIEVWRLTARNFATGVAVHTWPFSYSCFPWKQRYGRKRGTFEPRPARGGVSVAPLAGRTAWARTSGAETDSSARRGCLGGSGPGACGRERPVTRPRCPRGRTDRGARASFLEHGQGLPAQERAPTRQPDRTRQPRQVPASLSYWVFGSPYVASFRAVEGQLAGSSVNPGAV
jgi:hypothetical protein